MNLSVSNGMDVPGAGRVDSKHRSLQLHRQHGLKCHRRCCFMGRTSSQCQMNAFADSPQANIPPEQNHNVAEAIPLPRACSLSFKNGEYWLMISVALNILFVSVLLYRVNPRFFSQQSNVDGSQNIVSTADEAPLGKTESFDQVCSGQGRYEYDVGLKAGSCICHACFTGSSCSEVDGNCVINFDHGDPKMFEAFWSSNQEATATVLLGWQRMSYFADTNDICWFLESQLAREIKSLHKLVGNAVTDEYHIIIGTGSSQLIHAALYALSSTIKGNPVDVVSAVPFYSSYPPMTDFLQSGLHRWAGDAFTYTKDLHDGYIELVTSPGNPDGMLHNAVVNGTGPTIYDLAYYWPQFTPIVSPADYDIMLFTMSKVTGHAGTRIGWALVRDIDVAKRMTKYIELSSIGVSKDSQLRASQILNSIRNAYFNRDFFLQKQVNAFIGASTQKLGFQDVLDENLLFDYGYKHMESRWRQLRAVVDNSDCFKIEHFPQASCRFFGRKTVPHPAFAWLRCEKEEDCHAVFRANGILTRSGTYFGSSLKYIRISMVDRDKIFELFLNRLRSMTACSSG